MPLVLAAMFFAACVLDHDARLRIMAGYVEKAAKRLFGVPDFKYYALADGLRALLTRHPGRSVTHSKPKTDYQMGSSLTSNPHKAVRLSNLGGCPG
jgi:hypothetical protein